MTRRTLPTVLALALPLLLGGCASGGADSPRAAVDAYVKAVNAKDESTAMDVVQPGRSAEEEVRRTIRDANGSLRLTQVDITQDVSPDFASANLVGTSPKGKYQEQVTLKKQDDRWYLVLGD